MGVLLEQRLLRLQFPSIHKYAQILWKQPPMQPCNKQLTSPNTARPWIYSKVAVPSGHRQEACTRASTQTLTTPTTPVISTPVIRPVATTSTQLSNKVYGM